MCSNCSGDYENPDMTNEEESDLEQDRRTTGSFAEGQQRLALALDAITRACLMDGSDCGSNFCPPARTK